MQDDAMPFFIFLWTPEAEQHLAQHGVTCGEFEEIVSRPGRATASRSSGHPIAFGRTSAGRYLACVYELVDEITVLPITAYEPELLP